MRTIFQFLIILLPFLTQAWKSTSINRFNIKNLEFSHLDKKNIQRLEKMFYLKNNRYNPFFNQYKITIYRNSLNNTENNPNENVEEETFEERFKRIFNEQLQKEIELQELEELEEEMNKIDSNETVDEDEDEQEDDEEPIPRSFYSSINGKRRMDPKIFLYRQTPPPNSKQRDNDFQDNDNIFQVYKQSEYSFKDVGGYDKVKKELLQISDVLVNNDKYKKFNVRTPKGVVFEGSPGNGKTLLAKGFSGEVNVSFIPVSGSEFNEKYVGVGASRVRDLFKLAERNKPCIIFIDEIDAVARKRSSDEGTSNTERDQTLNQLLISLDGYKSSEGILVIGATNRVDLLDPAVMRPGRMDKTIFVGNPDSDTRLEIIKIHLKGKPIDRKIPIDYLVEITGGFSGAQIENLLNEAMLNALREDREMIIVEDIEKIVNRVLVGWQSTESKYSDDIIQRIVIHEMGHAVVGLFSKDHRKLVKVCLNLWSPKSPGYTIFENNDEDMNIHTKNGLFAHLMVLLGGRIAEEVFYGYSVTTGAKKDLEQAYQLAQSMILTYGMGKQNIYPDSSDISKYLIDQEVSGLLLAAHEHAFEVITNSKDMIMDCSEILKRDSLLKPEQIVEIINKKYSSLWGVYDTKGMYM
jgi:cell division protease FtsH